MKVLLTTTPKPIPILMGRYLSTDDSSYRFVADQGLFSTTSYNHFYSLHFLAQNICAPSVVIEWPTLDEFREELCSDRYDIVAISVKIIDIDRVSEMIDVVREVSPGTKVVVGGFGVLGVEQLREHGIDVADKADSICVGEGVEFMNRLLGVDQRLPRTSHLPVARLKLPWLPNETRIGYLLSALGCPVKCEFCATTAFIPNGRIKEVMTARELYESIRWYYDNHRDLHQTYVMDENFLAYKKKVNELGRYLREDEKYGLDRLSIHAFGTVLSISKWTPEELLLNGVGGIWTGIESFYSYDRKKARDVKGLIEAVHDAGIRTTLSWIIGDDVQTKENIDDDIEQFVALRAPASQISVLTAMPGTPLYTRLKNDGRLMPFKAGEMHLLGNNMKSLHFTHQERVDIAHNTYRRIYEENGSSIMRGMELDMNGYCFCRKSQNPYLAAAKLSYFRRRVLSTIPLVKTAILHAPNPSVRSKMEDLERRYVELFGPLSRSQVIVAERMLREADREMQRFEREGRRPIRDVPLMRWEYEGIQPFEKDSQASDRRLPIYGPTALIQG